MVADLNLIIALIGFWVGFITGYIYGRGNKK